MNVKKPKNEIKKAKTAYMIFMEEARKKEENKGLKFADYGRLWRELPQDEKDVFQEKSREDQTRYQEELKKWQEAQKEVTLDAGEASRAGDSGAAEDGTPEKSEKLLELPLANIRNIVKKDKEIKQIRKTALYMIAKATELFVEDLTSTAEGITLSNKRKNIALGDLIEAVNSGSRFQFVKDANIIDAEEVATPAKPKKASKSRKNTESKKATTDGEDEEEETTTPIEGDADVKKAKKTPKASKKKPLDDGTSNAINSYFKPAAAQEIRCCLSAPQM